MFVCLQVFHQHFNVSAHVRCDDGAFCSALIFAARLREGALDDFPHDTGRVTQVLRKVSSFIEPTLTFLDRECDIHGLRLVVGR